MAEGKSLRGIQHRPFGFGFVIRVVCLAGLPVVKVPGDFFIPTQATLLPTDFKC